ncbi:MAG: hypothetical protein OXJ90_24840 [Spirochaetaceae bacterium]|nr:hypothetical protein [Spirochaetaceae bacterium]
MDWIQIVFTSFLGIVAVTIAVQGLFLALEQRRDKRLTEIEGRLAKLEERINRSEWDWSDLKRLHPELVKDFPVRA